MRVESICIVPMLAMGNVMSSYTAQNIGAGKLDRVRQGYRTGYGIVAGFAVILCLIVELTYRPLVFFRTHCLTHFPVRYSAKEIR